ncbi:MAG TPA: RDD family protein [Chryseosolibacter sp.]
MNTTATPPVMTQANLVYASFGARLGAWLIDVIIIGCVQFVVVAPIMTFLGLGVASQVQDGEITEEAALGMAGGIMAMVGSAMLVTLAITLLYFALMESSKSQATLGKMALGIKVTDMDGNRLSFGKAFLRSIGKLVSSAIMYIGYLLAAFTEKKQALHDLIASTLVLKK